MMKRKHIFGEQYACTRPFHFLASTYLFREYDDDIGARNDNNEIKTIFIGEDLRSLINVLSSSHDEAL